MAYSLLTVRRFVLVRLPLLVFALLQILSVSSAIDVKTGPTLAVQVKKEVKPLGELAQFVLLQKENFRPVTAEILNGAKAEVSEALYQLETNLPVAPSELGDWSSYLELSKLHSQVALKSKSDFGYLNKLVAKLRSGEEGLEASTFRNLAVAVERFLNLSMAAEAKNPAKSFSQQVRLLAKMIESYQQQPNALDSFHINQRLGFVSALSNSPELINRIRRSFNHANVQFHVSESLVRRIAAKPISKCNDIRDCILGASISGSSLTSGNLSVDLVSSYENIALNISMTGQIYSNTRAYKKPVVIRNDGTTSFNANKRHEISDRLFKIYPATASACTSTVTRSIAKTGSQLGSRIVKKIAKKKVAETRPQANAISSAHAEARIKNKFDEEVIAQIRESRNRYNDKVRQTLFRRGIDPSQALAFTSSDNSLDVAMHIADKHQLAAPTFAPSYDPTADIVTHVHESAVNNLITDYIHDVVVEQQEATVAPTFSMTDRKLLAKIQEKMAENKQEEKADPKFKPWSLELRKSSPITIQFLSQKIKITLHVHKLISGDNPAFEKWNISAFYQPQQVNGEWKLVRVDELEVLPTSFDPRKKKSLSSEHRGVRTNLANAFTERADQGKGFPPEIKIPEIKLPAKAAELGTLRIQAIECNGGWLTLIWSL